jgi:hypothetical protein
MCGRTGRRIRTGGRPRLDQGRSIACRAGAMIGAPSARAIRDLGHRRNMAAIRIEHSCIRFGGEGCARGPAARGAGPSEPMMQPFILMQGLAQGLVTRQQISELAATHYAPRFSSEF